MYDPYVSLGSQNEGLGSHSEGLVPSTVFARVQGPKGEKVQGPEGPHACSHEAVNFKMFQHMIIQRNMRCRISKPMKPSSSTQHQGCTLVS